MWGEIIEYGVLGALGILLGCQVLLGCVAITYAVANRIQDVLGPFLRLRKGRRVSSNSTETEQIVEVDYTSPGLGMYIDDHSFSTKEKAVLWLANHPLTFTLLYHTGFSVAVTILRRVLRRSMRRVLVK